MPSRLSTILCVLLALVAFGCKRKPTNPENEIRLFIEKTEGNVESRNLSEIKESIASGYSDGKGLNKRRVVSLLQLQFLKRSSIHLLTRILSLNVTDDGKEADVSVLVAMAGVQVESVDSLKGLRANLMRFHFRLFKDGDEWLVRSSTWSRAKLGDFLRSQD